MPGRRRRLTGAINAGLNLRRSIHFSVSTWWSGGESGVVDDVVDGFLVGGGCGAQPAGRAGGLGELRQAGREHAVVDAGQDDRGVQAGAGDAITVGAGDALDELVAAEPAQVVGDLPGGPDRPCPTGSGWKCSTPGNAGTTTT
jgi:hypothetical protein